MKRLALVGMVIAAVLTGCRSDTASDYAAPATPREIPKSDTKVYDLWNGDIEVWTDPENPSIRCYVFDGYEAGGIACFDNREI